MHWFVTLLATVVLVVIAVRLLVGFGVESLGLPFRVDGSFLFPAARPALVCLDRGIFVLGGDPSHHRRIRTIHMWHLAME